MSQLHPERRSTATPDRWEPVRELEQVSERMRQMLDETFGGLSWPAFIQEQGGFRPHVDIEETDEAYVVEAELPGVKREDVSIELVGNELTISGEIKERERKGVLRRQTRRTGRFHYQVSLPSQVDAEMIDAKLSEGVLTVRVPKSERAERKRILIT
jgi:HSP20 family protein